MKANILGLLVVGSLTAPVAAAPVTINSSQVLTQAYDGGPPADTDTDYDYSTAYGTRTLTSTSGGNSSTTYINWQDTNAGALFDFDLAHVRTGAINAYALSLDQSLVFTVGLSDTTYSLSGQYSMTGPASVTFLDAYLYDLTTGAELFRDQSLSYDTANENFYFGVDGDGDAGDSTTGSLTGTLFAGHVYEFYFMNNIQANRIDDGATATGCVTLSIGGATGGGNCGVQAVPLPATAWLLLSGLGGLGFIGRRRRAA